MGVAYLEIHLKLTPTDPWCEIMAAQMGLLGFESFVDTPDGFKAYIPQSQYREHDFLQIDVFNTQGLEIKWQSQIIPPENWNLQWEQNFSPIRIADRCVVRADFHPPEKAEYELVITPKMSFGTGHHQTTQMMISFLLDVDCKDKRVLDMGTGTGVLAILAEKRGAKSVLAIDNDPWCIENTKENIGLNHCEYIIPELDDSVSTNKKFDLILANINRNVLLDQIEGYGQILIPLGDLLLSGFYLEDLSVIQNKCEAVGFRFIRNFKLNEWVAAHFIKL